ncbi:MAG: polyprenyl synthetase family protein, partial [archaeon]
IPSFEYDEKACTEAISNPVWNLLERGGKRWRPLLMKLAYLITEGREKESINKFLIIPELIHNGTLIIDDIEDDSESRRGKPCVHKLFGIDIAVNAGNALYYLPLLALLKNNSLNSETKVRLYEIINEEMIKLHIGQGMDIYWHNNDCNVTENQYLQMCAFKTGTLARISAKLGATLANGTEEQTNALGKFAESIGVAFQIQDDILNITNDSWGKDFGEDISEGKKSLIIIKTFEQADETNKKRLFEILNAKTKDKNIVQEAINIIKKHSGIEDSKKVAEELVSKAWEKLNLIFPESNSKNKLKLFADFMIKRKI